jgi:hypothetical protein
MTNAGGLGVGGRSRQQGSRERVGSQLAHSRLLWWGRQEKRNLNRATCNGWTLREAEGTIVDGVTLDG